MKQIELLEKEMSLLQDNIDRIRAFIKENKQFEYKPCSSHVVGELKHRCVALKQRCTIINKLSTKDFFRQ